MRLTCSNCAASALVPTPKATLKQGGCAYLCNVLWAADAGVGALQVVELRRLGERLFVAQTKQPHQQRRCDGARATSAVLCG